MVEQTCSVLKLAKKGWKRFRTYKGDIIMSIYKEGDFSGWCRVHANGTISGNVSKGLRVAYWGGRKAA